MSPHKTMHWVGGITPDEGVSWYSSEEVFGKVDNECSLDCVPTSTMQFVRIQADIRGEADLAKLFKKCLDASRVYDVWWQNLIKETN